MHRLVIACLIDAVFSAPGFAQAVTDRESTDLSQPQFTLAEAAVETPQPAIVYVQRAKPTRPSSLPMLYAGATALQSYDTALTMGLIGNGLAHETNPMMRTVVGNPAVFVAVKAGVTTTAILTAEHLWKNHTRTGAVVLMIATNVIMSAVAVHNTRAVH